MRCAQVGWPVCSYDDRISSHSNMPKLKKLLNPLEFLLANFAFPSTGCFTPA